MTWVRAEPTPGSRKTTKGSERSPYAVLHLVMVRVRVRARARVRVRVRVTAKVRDRFKSRARVSVILTDKLQPGKG